MPIFQYVILGRKEKRQINNFTLHTNYNAAFFFYITVCFCEMVVQRPSKQQLGAACCRRGYICQDLLLQIM